MSTTITAAPFLITSITFDSSESRLAEEGRQVSTLEEADAILEAIAAERLEHVGEGGSYTKTRITIRYTDPTTGEEGSYQGRWDVQANGTDASIMGRFKEIAEFALTEKGREVGRIAGLGACQDAAAEFVARGMVPADETTEPTDEAAALPTLRQHIDALTAEARAGGAEPEAVKYSIPMWSDGWRLIVERRADARGLIPLTVFRSYARSVGSMPQALRNLRAAGNAEDLAARYSQRPEIATGKAVSQ